MGFKFENHYRLASACKHKLQFSLAKGIEKADALTSCRAWQEDTVIRWTTTDIYCKRCSIISTNRQISDKKKKTDCHKYFFITSLSIARLQNSFYFLRRYLKCKSQLLRNFWEIYYGMVSLFDFLGDGNLFV